MSKIPFLNHLDLRSVSELQNAILHKTTSGSASNVEGKVIYDTGSNTIKYYNGSAWISLTGDGTKYDLLVPSGTTAIRLEGLTDSGNTNDDITITGGSNVTVTRNSATQLTIASTDTNTNQLTEWTLTDDDDDNTTIAHNDHVKFVMATGTLGTNTSGSGTDSDPYLVTLTSPNTQLSTEQVQDIVGAMVTNNTETRINVGYDDTTGTLDFVVNDMSYDHPTHPGDDIDIDTTALTGATVISDLDINITTDTLGHVTDANASVATRNLTLANLGYTGATDANNYSLDLTKLNAVTSAMTESNTLTFGDSGEDTQVTIKGNLTVTGTQTVNNVVTVSTSNGVQFEGTAADGNDATLVSVVANSDKTYTLPNITGHIPILTNDPGTTAISATAAQLNFVAGVTSGIQGQIDGKQASSTKLTELATMALATAQSLADLTSTEVQKIDGATAGTVVASKAVVVDSNKDVTGFRNITLSGELDAGSLDVSGDVDVDGTLETDALTINGATINSVIDGRITNREFKGNFPSSASSAGDTLTITHNLGTRDVIVQFYANVADITGNGSGDVDQYEEVKLSNTRATTNTITVVPLVALAANSLRVLVKEL